MLGKQWLNRYASIDMRGTAIERSRDRQRKRDGIATWYFEYVMESLPLMLQAALLLHGCALSRYLRLIDTTIASLAIGFTSFGILFYFFMVMAGAKYESCPYQTPGAHALRLVASAFRYIIGHSRTIPMFQVEAWQSRGNVMASLRVPCELLGALAVDVFRLGKVMVCLPIALVLWVYRQFLCASSTPGYGPEQEKTLLDLQCISWILNTSLDKAVHLSALEFLATAAALVDFNPTLIKDCFSILVDCVRINEGTVVVTQGLEPLAAASATCLLRTTSYLSAMHPTPGPLEDVCQKYCAAFGPNASFKGFSFCHTLGAIHSVFYANSNHPWFIWWDYNPSTHDEHTIFAHALTDLAQSEYQKGGRDRVPGWILRFALRSLSLIPLPPTKVVIDCLSIIAIDLGCDFTDNRTTIRYVHI